MCTVVRARPPQAIHREGIGYKINNLDLANIYQPFLHCQPSLLELRRDVRLALFLILLASG